MDGTTRDHIETAIDPAALAHRPAEIRQEMLGAAYNGCVGSILVSETDAQGQTQQSHSGPGEYRLHALKRVGDAVLSFLTVEHLVDPGAALPIPEPARL